MHHLMELPGDNVRQFANTFQNAARDAVNAHMNLTREATTASRGVPFPFEVSRPPEASASSFFNPVNSGPNDLQEASFGGDQDHSSSSSTSPLGTVNSQRRRMEDDSSDQNNSPALSSTSFSDPENGMQFTPFAFSDPPSPVQAALQLDPETTPVFSAEGSRAFIGSRGHRGRGHYPPAFIGSPVNPFHALLLPNGGGPPDEPITRMFSSPHASPSTPLSFAPTQLQAHPGVTPNLLERSEPISMFSQPRRRASFEEADVAAMNFHMGKINNKPTSHRLKNTDTDTKQLKELLASLSVIMAPEKFELLQKFTSVNAGMNEKLLKSQRSCVQLRGELGLFTQRLRKSEDALQAARQERDHLERASAHLRGELLDRLSTGHLKALRKDLKRSITKVESVIHQKEEEETKCSVCLIADKSHVLVPCGHRFCLECANKLDVCAHCRKRPQQIMELF